jgi:hypothetical protein
MKNLGGQERLEAVSYQPRIRPVMTPRVVGHSGLTHRSGEFGCLMVNDPAFTT